MNCVAQAQGNVSARSSRYHSCCGTFSEKNALIRAMKELDIPEADRGRLVVRSFSRRFVAPGRRDASSPFGLHVVSFF